MTEQDRMHAGQLYYAGNEALSAARDQAKRLTWRYNQMDPADWNGRTALLQELLGRLGKDSWIEPSFRCDYGSNITLGNGVFINYDCVFLDVAPITIGDRVLIAPQAGLYTASHPLDPEIRASGLEFGRPITLESDVWLGGRAVVCPGVTIGSGSIIAAGSVVTRDIPAGVLAAGSPCRVLRTLTDADRAVWERQRREYEASGGRYGAAVSQDQN
ncbi:sugar O-acetyltransferase [uncultured Dysosmobacter sp.]|uniref:sugar O-acetyltransferase n=1 Tax=uncultured Dysosmobacter sp. TaxID=2591384 RepID=UPI002631DAFD|nr:sugar O-acetyltransferase [uncultured Dysosmobacter sp.]